MSECKECSGKAQGQLVSRAERINWTVEILLGNHPSGDPDKIRVNVDHTLFLAKTRAAGRSKNWDDLGLDEKIELVESLTDWWPKKGIDP